jgi:predicted nucleic acid-binding Zn ribbon protein
MTAAHPPTPVRYGSRYGATTAPDARACPLCAAPLPSPRARYCSEACKQRAYRLRQAERTLPDLTALTRELQRVRALMAHTLYECPTCGERYLGVQRCPDCQHFCRSLGLGGACPHCDQLLLATELLD